jgi:hypothetical protein
MTWPLSSQPASDIDLFEINEAFCSVPIAAVRKLGLDESIVNVNGSGCSLGHPIAATGARIVVTMVHELRRRGKSLGVVSMCAGGGIGSAMVIEALLAARRATHAAQRSSLPGVMSFSLTRGSTGRGLIRGR